MISRYLFAIALAGMSFAALADDAAVARGESLFRKNMCFTCHGTVGQGGERNAGPRIAPNPWPAEAIKLQLRQPRQDMPRYDEKFVGNDDIDDIRAYLASLPPGPKARDVPLLSRM
ncbi:MAG: cytochrome c [Betaproteobacteria bacterium]|nr:cytochrome c [Betaproteobacteria bacterium]